MSDEDKWGFGDPAKARHVSWTTIGETRHGVLEILHGEHKHSYSSNSFYAKDDHGAIYDFDGHHYLIDVEIKSHNYLKESHLSGDEVRKGGTANIIVDGECVYSFFFRDPQAALLRAYNLITTLSEHSSDIFNKDSRAKLPGRKIYYHGVPAVIKYLILDQGCIVMEPAPGFEFKPQPWQEEDWESRDHATIKDEILSPHIWWWRD